MLVLPATRQTEIEALDIKGQTRLLVLAERHDEKGSERVDEGNH